MTDLIIRNLDDAPGMEWLHALRLQVLRPGQAARAAVWPLDDDPRTVHLGAFSEGRCVGIATVVPEDGWRLRGMAVEPSRQGSGIGARLVRELQERFASRGAPIWCNARTTAAGFYVRLGFAIEGEPFDVAGIGPHVVMRWTPADAGADPRRG